MARYFSALVATVVVLEAAAAFRIPVDSGGRAPIRQNCLRATHDKSLLDINPQNVEKVLDLVRPQLAADGGGVSLAGIDDHEISIKFDGACKACPHRVGTVKGVIEATLVRFMRTTGGKQITVKLVEN